MKRQFCITGMNCAGCAARVEKAARSVKGAEDVSVNLLTNTLTIDGDADDRAVISAVKNAGYGAERKDDSPKSEAASGQKSANPMKSSLILSLIILAFLMYITMGYNMFALPLPAALDGNYAVLGVLEMLLAGAIIIVNKRFFISGAKAIAGKSANMDSLISLGSSVSFLWSIYVLVRIFAATKTMDIASAKDYYENLLYFESSAMILVIISIGKLLESISKSRTISALRALLNLKPKKVRLITENGEVEINIDEVKKGDIFSLLPGERAGVDAVIIDGISAVDESAITGESMPVDKKAGDDILSGSINISGYLKCRAEKVGDEATISQIIKLVERASSTKPPIARTADKISSVFAPLIIALSLLVVILHLIFTKDVAEAIERGICTLVISCPCALGLATPVAVMVASGVGARNGILIKDAQALEAIAKARTILIDKTGTITTGAPSVCDVCASFSDTSELLKIAYALESKSEHPLSRAISCYAKEKGVPLVDASNFSEIAGEGLVAEVDGEEVRCGRWSFVEKYARIDSVLLKKADELSEEGKTLIFFSKGDTVLGIIAAFDNVKETSPQAISELKSLGLKTAMLTGDNDKCANHIARLVGVDDVYSSLLPQDKEKMVAGYKKHGIVAMVGDGINDAPSLARSDVSIAMAAASDIAVDTSQVVLTSPSLEGVVSFVRLGRKTLRLIKQNLFWAFFYNAVCIPIAAGAFSISMSPMFAALAMSFSSITVCLNALRLNTFRAKK